MFKQLIISCLMLLFFSTTTTNILAQAWMPADIASTTILVERFKYQNPDDLELDIDDTYEDQLETFVKKANSSLEKFNTKSEKLFAKCVQKHKLAVSGKIDDDYEDTKKYRYVLKREIFFGEKKLLKIEAKTEKKEETKTEIDKSYFAYRYYFYDRVEEEDLSPYYFSGDTWMQLERIIYWLNSKNKGKKAATTPTKAKKTNKAIKPATKKKVKASTDKDLKNATERMKKTTKSKPKATKSSTKKETEE